MASISKDKRSGKYRVLIRKRGLPTISKTFTSRKDTVTWAKDKEGDREKHITEGNTVARSMTLQELIDEYLSQWEGRDSSTLSRLAWWQEQFGHKLIGEIDKGKKESRGRIRFLSDDERKALLLACRESKWNRLYLILMLAITTGARRGELIRFKCKLTLKC